MAGRGAIPVVLSPDYIEAIRYRYVETDQPVREICAEFVISTGKVDRLIKKHGWPMRMHRPPRELPMAHRLREESRRLAAGSAFPARGATCNVAPQTRGPGLADDTGVPGLQRTTKTCCAAPGTQPDDPTAPSPDDSETADPIARIEALVLRELAAEEAVRAQLGSAPRERAEAEKTARTLAILTQTLQHLQRLRAAQAAQTQSGPSDDEDDDDDELPADLDAFRLALAQRIEAFVASQPDDEGVEEDAAAGPAAAGP